MLLCNEKTVQFKAPSAIEEKKIPFELPKAYKNNDQVIEYLMLRGISRDIIDYCIENKLLYESADYYNATFVGYDSEGIARYAALRGTWGHMSNQFKGEVSESNKSFCFSVPATVKSSKLIVTESAIDALSVATIRNDIGKVHYLSIGGAYAQGKDMYNASLPKALERYLNGYKDIKDVELCLDNDKVGVGASFFIMSKLKGLGYVVFTASPDKGKDWNEKLSNSIKQR